MGECFLKNGKRLLLVSFGNLEKRNSTFYGKNAVINYLHDISSYFDETIYIPSFISRNTKSLKTKLNSSKIKVIELKYQPGRKGISLMKDFLADNITMGRLFKNEICT